MSMSLHHLVLSFVLKLH